MLLLLVAGSFHFSRVNRVWLPLDEGTLAHAAERVLDGELPHRDFDDVYTGGLAMLNAAGFQLFGTDLLIPRLLLFGLYLVTVPAVYYLASRFLGPVAALLAAALALIWNVPVYTAAMPSWYNLLFALLGAAALVRHGETGSRRWVLAAGVLAGLSCAMKITGLFFVAAALLWFLFAAQDAAGSRAARPDSSRFASIVHGVALAAFAGLVVALVRPRLTAAELIYFLVPIGAVIAYLGRRELALAAAGRPTATPWSRIGLFLLGWALPLLAFAVPYLTSDSLGALLRGVLLAPVGRISEAAVRPPAPVTAAAALPLAALLYLWVRHGRIARSILFALAGALACALYWSSDPVVFAVIVAAMRWVPVLAVIAAVLVLWPAPGHDPAVPAVTGAAPPGRERRQALLLLAALTAVVSLIQYPFAHPIYLWYVAPLAVLTLAGVVGTRPGAPPAALGVVSVFFIAFSVQQITKAPATEPLAIPRASLLVPAADRVRYERVLALLDEHARGEYIWAGPDTPELYYLSARRNPTRHLFEFLAQRGDPEAEILAGIERHDVNVIVLNRRMIFSRLSEELKAALVRRFPSAEQVGDLEVRWRP